MQKPSAALIKLTHRVIVPECYESHSKGDVWTMFSVNDVLERQDNADQENNDNNQDYKHAFLLSEERIVDTHRDKNCMITTNKSR